MIYKIVLGLGVLAAVLTVGALLYSVLAWKNSYWGIAARVHYTLVTVAAVAFVWFLNHWNLLGWRFYWRKPPTSPAYPQTLPNTRSLPAGEEEFVSNGGWFRQS